MDSITGELSDPIHYKSLSEYPFPLGWPLHYVTPSYFATPRPVTPAGAPLPPPAPSVVSPFAMVANFLLVVIAMSALIYCLQTTMPRYSLLTLLILTAAVPLNFAFGRLTMMLFGSNAVRWYGVTIYFSPIAAAVALKYSLFQRVKWPQRRLNWISDRRSFDDYNNADDALAAASTLDRRGDWDASINLYSRAAKRWPEHDGYIQRCIDRINEKRSLAHT